MGNNPSEERGPDNEDVDLDVRDRDYRSDPTHSASPWPGDSRDPYGHSSGSTSESAKQDAARANEMGVEMLKQNQHSVAIRHFKAALEYEPNSVQVLNNIGLAYAKMQDFTGAYEWYEKAYKQDTSDVETLFSLAWVERKRQRYVHARELFQKVLDTHPEHVKALYLLGDILKTRGEYDAAAVQFERLIRLDSSSVDGHISLAQCYEQTRRHLQAEKTFRHALQLAPHRTEITFFLGRVYYNSKQYKQAVSCMERVGDGDPRAFEARTYSAKALCELEDHDRAIQVAERAAEFRPHPDVMHFIGEQCLRRGKEGDQQLASQWFRQALEEQDRQQPGHVHVGSLMELGQLMFRQCRWPEAEAHFTRLCEADRNNVVAIRTLALVKFKLRKLDSCRRCCDEALRLEPLCTDALWLLAELNRDAADDRWYLSLRSSQDVTVADICQTVAKGYLTRKQVKEALQWLGKVQHYVPSDQRVREAVSFLQRQGNAVNPQDVLDILEDKRASRSSGRQTPAVEVGGSPSSSSRHRAGGYGEAAGSAGSLKPAGSPERHALRSMDHLAGSPGESSANGSEDLERLLRRAERGRAGADAGQLWQEVLTGARAVLRRRPDDPLALRCAAKALLSSGGEHAEILAYARRAQEQGGSESGFTLGSDLHAYLASAHERERDPAGAERHWTAALSSKPGDEAAMLGLAKAMLHQGRTTDAKQLYEQVSAARPTCAESTLKLAEIAFEAGDYSEAYRSAQKATKLAPSDAAAFFCMGQVCIKTSRTDEAVRALEQALKLQPSDTSAVRSLASLQRSAGREEEAVLWFKKLLEIRPGDYECSLALGQLHARRGMAGANQAIHYFRSCLQCRPSTREAKDIYLQMATVQGGMSAWKEAQQTMEGAVRELPDDPDLWEKLLSVYEKQQDVKGQQQCHRRLLQLNGTDASRRVAFAELLLSEGHVREAREQLKVALRHDPQDTEALVKMATSWRQEQNLEEARKGFEQVLALAPTHAEALEGAAYCHRKSNNLDSAIQLYQQCLKVKPTSEGPLYYLGDILYRQHRHAECQHYLDRLVNLNCSADYKTGALYLLAKSHVALDEYEEAEKHARAGLSLKPNHPHFFILLALVKNRMASYDTSIDAAKLALQNCDQGESDQLRVEIHDCLAQAYERKQEYSSALAELEKALHKDPSHVSSLITRGLVNIHMKQLDQAESDFRRALAMEKNNALALVRLGYCRLLAGEHAEATQQFQRALQQRCGTVTLPKSVKGSARIYMALSFSGQQDTEAAFSQLVEARKSHRNFNAVCSGAKEVIVKGECESLVNQLRGIPDLDVNLSQAWQLVHLLAKELEVEFRAPSAPSSAPKAPAPSHKPKSLSSGVAPASVLGQLPARLPGQAASTSSHQVVSSSLPPEERQRSWEAPAPQQERRAWGSPADSGQERRAWGAADAASAQKAPERRAWTESSSATPSAPSTSQGREVLNGQKNLVLAKHEQIDFGDLTHNECLGTGGFGAVYRGFYREKEVAIKKLFCEDGGNISDLQLAELEQEVAALRNLNHPRLVSFIGACLKPPNLCIVTEFMPGGSLHHLLHKNKTKLELATHAKIALHICEGVSFLHGLTPQVVHRDLKSLNIILDLLYNAKICDFGLTQSMEKTHNSVKEGGNGGSPRYMAPECYDCKGKITEKVDVWAMGCILVEAFGGPLPYDDCSNIQQIVAKVLIDKEVPFIPHNLPRGVAPIVEDCFHFDIKQRTTARDVFSRLKQLHLP